MINKILFLLFIFIPCRSYAYVVQIDEKGNHADTDNLILQEPSVKNSLINNSASGDSHLVWALIIFFVLIMVFVIFLKSKKK